MTVSYFLTVQCKYTRYCPILKHVRAHICMYACMHACVHRHELVLVRSSILYFITLSTKTENSNVYIHAYMHKRILVSAYMCTCDTVRC
jgi:hypothetical protein